MKIPKKNSDVEKSQTIAIIWTLSNGTGQCTVVQISQESGRKCWATCSSVRSFARTTVSLTLKLVGKWMIRWFKTTWFCPTVGWKEEMATSSVFSSFRHLSSVSCCYQPKVWNTDLHNPFLKRFLSIKWTPLSRITRALEYWIWIISHWCCL